MHRVRRRSVDSHGIRLLAFSAVAVFAPLAAPFAACSRKPSAGLADVRPVMEHFLDAEREHRNSHGGFWRDRQPTVDRADALRALGVDIGDAAGFEFTIDPPESGLDPELRLTARGVGGASNVWRSCVLEAAAPKPDCRESGG